RPPAAVPGGDAARLATDDPCRAPRDLREERLQAERGGAGASDLEQRGRLAGPPPFVLEAPRLVDGERRLLREAVQRRRVALGKARRAAVERPEKRDDPSIWVNHWRHDDRGHALRSRPRLEPTLARA